MPWVLSGCWEGSNLTNERISLKTHYGNSRTGKKVYAVYEAGPLGYGLYRKLRELGIEALVCAPECLEAGSKRKHNKIVASKWTCKAGRAGAHPYHARRAGHPDRNQPLDFLGLSTLKHRFSLRRRPFS